jgi:hypothetical protein
MTDERESQAWAEQKILEVLRAGREKEFSLTVSARAGHWIVALDTDPKKPGDPLLMPTPPPTGEGSSLGEALRVMTPWSDAMTPALRAFFKFREGVGYRTHLARLSALVSQAESVRDSLGPGQKDGDEPHIDLSYFMRVSTNGASVDDLLKLEGDARVLAECCVEKLRQLLKQIEAIKADDDLFEPLDADDRAEWEAGYNAGQRRAPYEGVPNISWIGGYRAGLDSLLRDLPPQGK